MATLAHYVIHPGWVMLGVAVGVAIGVFAARVVLGQRNK